MGDTPMDIQAAIDAGATAIAVATGAGSNGSTCMSIMVLHHGTKPQMLPHVRSVLRPDVHV